MRGEDLLATLCALAIGLFPPIEMEAILMSAIGTKQTSKRC